MGQIHIDVQNAITEIKLLIAEVENLKKSTSTVNQNNKAQFDKLEAQVSKLRTTVGALGNKMNYLNAIMKKNSGDTNQNTSSKNRNTSATNSNANAQEKNAKSTGKSTKAIKQNSAASKSATGIMNGLTVSVKSLLAAFGIIAGLRLFGQILKDIYNLAKTFDSLNFTMEKVTETTNGYISSQIFMTELVDKFGVELVSTTNRWLKFLAAAKNAGLSLYETEKIFRSMTKAASVLGLKTDELQGVYLALEQMLSKGKVTTEELRRQLGERLPGAMGIMAAALGKTIPELDKMLKKGEVLSAEALPKFAKAVEIAYGIQNVQKVETLVAAQNRLTAAWQTFVKTITEGDSVIKKVLGGILEQLTWTINWWSNFFADQDQQITARVGKYTEVLKKQLDAEAQMNLSLEDIYAQRAGYANKQLYLEAQVKKAQSALNNAVTKEEQELAEAHYAKSLQDLQEFNEQKEAYIKDYAEKNIAQTKYEYDQDIKLREQLNAKMLELQDLAAKAPYKFKKDAKPFFEFVFGDTEYLGKAIKSQEDFNTVMEQATSNVVVSTSKWILFKKLLEESHVNPGLLDDVETLKARLRDVADLMIDIQRKGTQLDIAKLEFEVDNETLNLDDRRDALEKLNEKLLADSQLQANKELAINQKKYDDDLAKANEYLAEKKISYAEYTKFVEDLQTELDQSNSLVDLDKQKRDLDIAKKFANQKLKLLEYENQQTIDIVQDTYNQKIIALQDEYNAANTTAERKKQIEEELKKVSVEAAIAIIQAKIKIIEATEAMTEADTEYIAKLKRDINDLKASIGINKGDDGDIEQSWYDLWNNILDYTKEFTDAVGGIFDGIFEGRIENINAEIEAEKERYDTLIDLAEGEEVQQKILRRNKEKDIKALEKKRLKEEQKQAKARKAFAVADIAISTSQAILSIWAQVPKFDFGVSAGLMTAFVSALGAAQIAAVLAQPIPKYKEGTKGEVTKPHLGIINDGIYQEYVERGGKILTTKTKDAIVSLEPGDVVHKNFDDMMKKSVIMNVIKEGEDISKQDFDKFFLGIETSISRGFRKAKVINKISTVSNSDYNAYKQSILNWSKK